MAVAPDQLLKDLKSKLDAQLKATDDLLHKLSADKLFTPYTKKGDSVDDNPYKWGMRGKAAQASSYNMENAILQLKRDEIQLKAIKIHLDAIEKLDVADQANYLASLNKYNESVDDNVQRLTKFQTGIAGWESNEKDWNKRGTLQQLRDFGNYKYRSFSFPKYETNLRPTPDRNKHGQEIKEAHDLISSIKALEYSIERRGGSAEFKPVDEKELVDLKRMAESLQMNDKLGEFVPDANFVAYQKKKAEFIAKKQDHEKLKSNLQQDIKAKNEKLFDPYRDEVAKLEADLKKYEQYMAPETDKTLKAELDYLKTYQSNPSDDESMEKSRRFEVYKDIFGKLQTFRDSVEALDKEGKLKSDTRLQHSTGYEYNELSKGPWDRNAIKKGIPPAEPMKITTQAALDAEAAAERQANENEKARRTGMNEIGYIKDDLEKLHKRLKSLENHAFLDEKGKFSINQGAQAQIKGNLETIEREIQLLEQLQSYDKNTSHDPKATEAVLDKLKLYKPKVDAVKTDTEAMNSRIDEWGEKHDQMLENISKTKSRFSSPKASPEYTNFLEAFPKYSPSRVDVDISQREVALEQIREKELSEASDLDAKTTELTSKIFSLGPQVGKIVSKLPGSEFTLLNTPELHGKGRKALEINDIGEFQDLDGFKAEKSAAQRRLVKLQELYKRIEAEVQPKASASSTPTPAVPTVTASSTATAASTPASNAVPTNVVPLKPAPPTPTPVATATSDATAGTDTTAAPVPQPPTAPALHLVPKQEAAPKVAPTPPTTTPGDAAAVATTDTAKPTSVVGGDATAGTTATATGIGTGTATQTAADVTPKPADASATVAPSNPATSNSPAASSTPATSNVPATPSTPADSTITPTPDVTNAAIAAATMSDADLKAKEEVVKAAALAASVAAQIAQEAQEEAARAAADKAKPTSFEVAPAANTTLEIEKAKKPGTTPHATMGTGGEDLSFKAQGGAKPDEAADAKAKKKIGTKKDIPLKWKPVPITWKQFFKELGRLFLQIGETYKIFKGWVHKKLDAKKLKEQQEALAKQQNAAKQLANNAKALAVNSNPTLAANPNFQALTNELDEAAAEADNQAKDALDAVNAQLSLIANTPNTPAATTQPAAASTVTNPSAVATTPTPAKEPKNKEEKVTAEAAVATAKGEKTASADVAGTNADSAAAVSKIPAAPPMTTPEAPAVPKASEIPEKKPGVVADKDAPKPLTAPEKRALQAAKASLSHITQELRSATGERDLLKNQQVLAGKNLAADLEKMKELQTKIEKLDSDIKRHEDNVKVYQSKVNNLEVRNKATEATPETPVKAAVSTVAAEKGTEKSPEPSKLAVANAPNTEVLRGVLPRVKNSPSDEEIVPSKNHVSVSQGKVANLIARLQEAQEAARDQNIHGSQALPQNTNKPADGEVVPMNAARKLHDHHADDRIRSEVETQAQRAQAEQAEQDRKIVEQAKAQAQAEQTGTEGTTPDASRPKAASGPRV